MAQHMKTGNWSFKRGIIALHFGEKYKSHPLAIFEEAWWTRWVAAFTEHYHGTYF